MTACARIEDGTVTCWGANESGEAGDGTHGPSTFAVPVTGIAGAYAMRAMAAGMVVGVCSPAPQLGWPGRSISAASTVGALGALGPGFGFALGATTLMSSALITGGVGPWLPFQMIAAGCATKLVFSWAGNPGAGPLYALVQVDRLSLSLAEIGTIGVTASIAATLSCLAWGALADRWGGRLLTILGLLAVAAILPLLSLAGTFASAMTIYVLEAVAVALVVAMFLLFLGTGPVNTLILETVPAGLRATAMAGSIFAIHLFGDLWSPRLVGMLSDRWGDLRLACLWVLPGALCVGAAFWLVISSVFALIASIKFHSPGFLSDIAALTYGRVHAAHLNALAYGFAAQAGIGVALALLARSASRRCTTVTERHMLVRYVASSIAVSPPPITSALRPKSTDSPRRTRNRRLASSDACRWRCSAAID